VTNGPDNAELLFKRLDDLVAEIIDRFANEGHRTVTVIETLQDVIAKHRLAYDRDPIRLKTSRSQRTIGPPRRPHQQRGKSNAYAALARAPRSSRDGEEPQLS
jgi:hypothetical protein